MQHVKSRTTIHLTLPDPRRLAIPAPVSLAIVVVCMAGIIAAIGRIQSSAPVEKAVPTPGLPIIIIATAMPQVQQVIERPPAPTPDMALRQELAALQARVAELEALASAAPAAQPQVVYVQAPETNVEIPIGGALPPAAPYQLDNAPAPEPQQAASTAAPQPAQLAQPHIEAPAATPVQQEQYPAIVKRDIPYVARPGGPSEVDYINTTTEWKQEHCISSGASEVCIP